MASPTYRWRTCHFPVTDTEMLGRLVDQLESTAIFEVHPKLKGSDYFNCQIWGEGDEPPDFLYPYRIDEREEYRQPDRELMKKAGIDYEEGETSMIEAIQAFLPDGQATYIAMTVLPLLDGYIWVLDKNTVVHHSFGDAFTEAEEKGVDIDTTPGFSL